jgi:cyclophilin family peptidyl-prolyl cis-trans isomerase/protein-disulfide isomerase
MRSWNPERNTRLINTTSLGISWLDRVSLRLEGFLFCCCLIVSACGSPAQQFESPLLTKSLVTDTPTTESGCSVISSESTQASDPTQQIPSANQLDLSQGPANAAVTLIEYCDFQAPGCRAMSSLIDRLEKENPDTVRFVFRPVPLIDILDKSELAIKAALSADKQNKFWEIYELLFSRYDEWASLSPEAFNTWIVRQIKELDIDRVVFAEDFVSVETQSKVQAYYDAAKLISVPSVPHLFINGIWQPTPSLDYNAINGTIQLILLGERQFTDCPPIEIDPAKSYLATLQTDKGDIVIELFPEKAPLAVNSFIFLARQGWFDEITFHRVIPGFMAQSGDPSGTGQGNPGYFFKNEDSELKFDKPGVVGMANAGRDTNGSQFFITYSPAPHLDGGFTIFGQVVEGMDILEQLSPRDPEQFGDIQPGSILNDVEIHEN